jgi:hypothetical protein
MKHIRRQLENTLEGIVEDIRFFAVRGNVDTVSLLEIHADNIKEQIDILTQIEKEGEGNLINFNSDGTFKLWCIRIPDGGQQIVEHYNVDLNFADYDELLETADCIDVTDVFDIEAISHSVIVTDNIDDCNKTDVYYLVSNDSIDLMRGC